MEIHDVLIDTKSVRVCNLREENMNTEEVVSVWDTSDRFEEEVEANECKGASGRAASGAQR